MMAPSDDDDEAYRLIEGSKLKHNLCDPDGSILVRAGSVVNQALIDRLGQRGISLGLRATLDVMAGAQAGLEIPIEGKKLYIGRGDDCQIRPDSNLVSNRHCVIYTRSASVFCKDLNSTNGTFVNKHQIKQLEVVELADGDVLIVGDMALRVSVFADLKRVAAEPATAILNKRKGQEVQPDASKTGGIDQASLAEFHRLLRGDPKGNEEWRRFLETPEPPPADPDAEANAKAIVIADERETVRTSFLRKLRTEGYKCASATDVSALFKILDSYVVDLIIWSFPMAQGEDFSYLRAVRRRSRTKKVPIFLVADGIDSRTARELVRLGVNALVVANDFRLETFLQQVRQHVGE